MTTSNEIYAIVDDGDVLLPSKDNCIIIETHHDSDNGTFPKVSNYVKFYNKVTNDGIEHWLKSLMTNSCVIQGEGYKFTLANKWDTSAILKFDKPIKVCFGKIGDKLVIDEVSEIKGHFEYDTWWLKNGAQNKLPNVMQLLFQIEEYIS